MQQGHIATLLIHGAMTGIHLIAIPLMVTAGRFFAEGIYEKSEMRLLTFFIGYTIFSEIY